MIRKAIILMLTLGAVGIVALCLIGLGWPVVYAHHGDEVSVRCGVLCIYRLRVPWGPGYTAYDWRPFLEVLLSGGYLHRLSMPLWLPFLVLAAYPTIALFRGPVRSWHRRRWGYCVECRYDLTGNVSGVCPECGTEFDHSILVGSRPGSVDKPRR